MLCHANARRFAGRLRWLRGLVLLTPVFVLPRLAMAEDLFGSEEPFVFRIEAPIGLISQGEPQFEPGRLIYRDANGEKSVELQLRERGHSRSATCAFPPLLLDFPTKDMVGTMFEGQNRLKLVTHCEANPSYEQYVLIEYLTYKVLGLLTDMTLRARLAKVTYYDTERKREIAVRFGILLEDEDRFAERKELKRITDPEVERSRYDGDALGFVNLFEFFIGNTDWAVTAPTTGGDECCHNIVPYLRSDGMLVPVPYDFDSSGLVDVPYALPDERLKIATVRQRVYRGTCEPMTAIEPRFAPFDAQREKILALFSAQEGLSDRTRAKAKDYLEGFYELRADKKKAERAFSARC